MPWQNMTISIAKARLAHHKLHFRSRMRYNTTISSVDALTLNKACL